MIRVLIKFRFIINKCILYNVYFTRNVIKTNYSLYIFKFKTLSMYQSINFTFIIKDDSNYILPV